MCASQLKIQEQTEFFAKIDLNEITLSFLMMVLIEMRMRMKNENENGERKQICGKGKGAEFPPLIFYKRPCQAFRL